MSASHPNWPSTISDRRLSRPGLVASAHWGNRPALSSSHRNVADDLSDIIDASGIAGPADVLASMTTCSVITDELRRHSAPSSRPTSTLDDRNRLEQHSSIPAFNWARSAFVLRTATTMTCVWRASRPRYDAYVGRHRLTTVVTPDAAAIDRSYFNVRRSTDVLPGLAPARTFIHFGWSVSADLRCLARCFRQRIREACCKRFRRAEERWPLRVAGRHGNDLTGDAYGRRIFALGPLRRYGPSKAVPSLDWSWKATESASCTPMETPTSRKAPSTPNGLGKVPR